MSRLVVAVGLLLAVLFPLPSRAQWQTNGVGVCTQENTQRHPAIVSDGAGGVIAAWEDGRNPLGSDVYVQRLNASGSTQWATDGVPVCTAPGSQTPWTAVSDGSGGAIVIWTDHRGVQWDIYAQRVNASGTALWTHDGVAVCTATDAQAKPSAASDGAGGAIVTWYDYRSGTSWDIYAQRVDASGNPQWTLDGVPVCTAPNHQREPKAVAAGDGRAIITWYDYRTGPNSDIYARMIDAGGNALWEVPLCTAPGDQRLPEIASDGGGGAIVAWRDERVALDLDIYAQKVSLSGAVEWMADGVPVCTAVLDQYASRISSDGAGGALLAWLDNRSGNYDIYAQRLNAAGAFQWATNGIPVCTAENYQNLPVIASDGAGGAIVAWLDPRNPNLGTDVYAQWLDPSGFPRWTADGIPVCSAANNQDAPVMVPEGAGGAIVGWEDYRDGQSDIYAMRIGDQPIAVAITSFNAVENEGAVILRGTFRSDIGIDRVNVYRAAGTDADPFVRIDAIYDARTAVFEYVDGDVTPGRTYSYRIGVSDADGEIVSPTIAVSVSPLVARLDQNWPNPFNPSTRIRFVVPERGHVEVMVYDAAGQVVRTLVDGVQGHGAHEIIWDGRDNNGTPVSSGVYLCRMQVGIRSASRKMVLIR